MTRAGINIQDVFEAADKINKKNQTVTIDKVRSLLKTGSNSTISKYLSLWKERENKNIKKTSDYYRGYKDAVNRMSNILKTL